MADDAYQMHVVCCGDLDQLERRHRCVGHLISRASVATYSGFPGACAEFPLFFYLESGGQVCSYFRTIPDEITVDDDRRPWAWTGDNFTLPEFRNRGLSTQLHREATQYLHRLGIGRGSVFSTAVTLHTFRKLGFTIVGYAKRFLLMRSLAPLLKAHVANTAVRRVAEAFAKPLTGTAMAGLRLWNRAISRGAGGLHAACFSSPEVTQFLTRMARNAGSTLACRPRS